MPILNLIEDVEKYSQTMIPSFDKLGKPKYRIAKKAPCFIGKLIKDEFYKPSFENLPIAKLVVHPDFQPVIKDLRKSYALKSTPTLVNALIALQGIHDGIPVLNWAEEFASLKEKHTPKPVTLTAVTSTPPAVL